MPLRIPGPVQTGAGPDNALEVHFLFQSVTTASRVSSLPARPTGSNCRQPPGTPYQIVLEIPLCSPLEWPGLACRNLLRVDPNLAFTSSRSRRHLYRDTRSLDRRLSRRSRALCQMPPSPNALPDSQCTTGSALRRGSPEHAILSGYLKR